MFHIGKDDWYQWMDTLFTNFDRCACNDFVEFSFLEVTGNYLNLHRLSLLCVCLYCACVITVYVSLLCVCVLTVRLSLLCVCVLTVCVSLLCVCVLTVRVCTYCACALTLLQSSWTCKLHYLIFFNFFPTDVP